MSTTKHSGIAWTHWTFNPWRGCTKVNEACKFCYADQLSARNPKTLGVWGNNGVRVFGAESYWKLPLKWNETARNSSERHRVFCASLADVFEDWQGPMTETNGVVTSLTMSDARKRLFSIIDETPNLDWLLLTKRPENIRKFWIGGYRPNVWRGTSIGLQSHYDTMKDHLIRTNDLSPVSFLSCEPLLGPLCLDGDTSYQWVILGCESRGPKSVGRYSQEYEYQSAAISINSQCRHLGIPVFNKQVPVGGKLSHDPSEWNSRIRSQDSPEVSHA